MAVAFAGLLNLALATSFVWTEVEPLTPPVRTIVWMAVGLMWLVSLVWSITSQHRSSASPPAVAQNAFAQAVEHYLRREWYEAQQILGGMLRANARDVEARLMLASVLRQTGRRSEATAELDRLALLEDSRPWEFEIGRERRRLAGELAPSDEISPEQDEPVAEVRFAA